ncbi:hypothetical protein Verru16b_03519 [Lacunisphaera limnophila]|uniref:Uncharacterized protein n=1 Tax=Lacunisphaera limnophila TaxID=1838286 RepID=A0A1D8AZU6_9BACT|nr:hypothetical protein Verru16b_03519 [Lacunisphaera limnophila]
MRADFSPTSAAARQLATRGAASKSSSPSTPPMEVRSCEWPRRDSAPAPRGGIWRALQQIQARHA